MKHFVTQSQRIDLLLTGHEPYSALLFDRQTRQSCVCLKVLMKTLSQIDARGDAILKWLLAEFEFRPTEGTDELSGSVVRLFSEYRGEVLALFSTTTVFGRPVDVTLARTCD